ATRQLRRQRQSARTCRHAAALRVRIATRGGSRSRDFLPNKGPCCFVSASTKAAPAWLPQPVPRSKPSSCSVRTHRRIAGAVEVLRGIAHAGGVALTRGVPAVHGAGQLVAGLFGDTVVGIAEHEVG